jgi:DNA-binding transcriptional LysR family regulator
MSDYGSGYPVYPWHCSSWQNNPVAPCGLIVGIQRPIIADLGFSRPVATAAIKALEASLGARLLQRTTRHVQPSSRVRARLPATSTRMVPETLPPALRLASSRAARIRYPAITLQIGESERDVDLVREGVDCVIRGGHLPDSKVRCVRAETKPIATCPASPSIVCGVPYRAR